MGEVVVVQRLATRRVLEEDERREVRQHEPAVEDQGRLEPAVGDERPLGEELWESIAIG
jgi:hypothetical protein